MPLKHFQPGCSRKKPFHLRYLELCKNKNIHPLPEVKVKNKDFATLDFFGDRAKVDDWLSIINALFYDTSLNFIAVKLRKNYLSGRWWLMLANFLTFFSIILTLSEVVVLSGFESIHETTTRAVPSYVSHFSTVAMFCGCSVSRCTVRLLYEKSKTVQFKLNFPNEDDVC